jgi:hypothetical protein
MVLLDQGPDVGGVLCAIALARVVEWREDVVALDPVNLAPGLRGHAALRYGATVMFLLG